MRPHDFCGHARFRVRRPADVHDDLIHRHAPEKGAGNPVHHDAGALMGQGTQVAVRIAYAHGRHPGGMVRHISAPVGNAVAFRQRAHHRQAGKKGHGRLQLRGPWGGNGGKTVQHQAGAAHVVGGNFIIQGGGAVGQVAILQGQFLPDAGGHPFKEGDLPERDFPVLVRAGQVCSQAFRMQAVQFSQAGKQFFKLVRQESAAAHSRIHGKVDGQRLSVQPRQGIVMRGFLHGGNEGAPAVQHDFLPFLRERGAQDVRAGAAARLADAPGFPHIGHPEESDAFRIQRAANLFQAVAIGAGLHDGHVIFPFGRLFDDIQVMADGPKVDFGPGAGRAGCWHGWRMAERLKKEGRRTLPAQGIVRL